MESISKLVSSWSYSRESAASRTTGVYGNPNLIAGLLLGYLLLGIITVIMAFCTQSKRLSAFNRSIVLISACQYSGLRAVQNIHDSLLSVLFIHIITGATAIASAVYLILGTCDYACSIVSTVWFLSKSFGIVLHLLCALLSVLHLCNPHWRVQLRSIGTVVILLTMPFLPLYYFFPLVGFIGLAVITFGLALAIITQSCGSTASPSTAASKGWIVFVAMFTFLVIYLPTFVLDCLLLSYPNNFDYLVISVNLLYGTNIQLALDGFLCLLILRLPAEVEEEQQQPQYSIEIPRVNTIQNPYFK